MAKISKTSFATELKVRGLNLSDKEIKYLQDIAVMNYKEECIEEFVMKTGKLLHNIVFTVALADTFNTILHNTVGMAVKEGRVVREFKRDYNKLMKATDDYKETFMKMFKDIKGFEEPLLSYSDDFFKLFNDHLKAINEKEINS